jgi:hypothetical protein
MQQLAFSRPEDPPKISSKLFGFSVLPELRLLVGKLHSVVMPAGSAGT